MQHCVTNLCANFPPRPGPDELSEFRRVFTSQLLFGVFAHHLWVSLWEHPVSNCFTRSQRVTCSALVLHLYFALSVLWYGAVGTEWLGYEIDNTTLFNNTTSLFSIHT